MTEPRTRTAAEVADHAAAAQADAHKVYDVTGGYASALAKTCDVHRLAGVVKRLAAQVEDLAAVVDGVVETLEIQADPNTLAAIAESEAEADPFPPVAWPLTIKCEVDPELDSFTLHHSGGGFTLAATHTDPYTSFVDAGRWVYVMLSNNDARLLAHAILTKLGDE